MPLKALNTRVPAGTLHGRPSHTAQLAEVMLSAPLAPLSVSVLPTYMESGCALKIHSPATKIGVLNNYAELVAVGDAVGRGGASSR